MSAVGEREIRTQEPVVNFSAFASLCLISNEGLRPPSPNGVIELASTPVA